MKQVVLLAALAAAGPVPGTVQDVTGHPSHAHVIARETTALYRGDAVLAGGRIQITLPDFFERMTSPQNRSVQLTCKGSWSPLSATPVTGGKFVVSTTDAGSPTQAFWWEVKAEYLEGK